MSTPVGGYILAAEPVQINAGRPQTPRSVRNDEIIFFRTNGPGPVSYASAPWEPVDWQPRLAFGALVKLGQQA